MHPYESAPVINYVLLRRSALTVAIALSTVLATANVSAAPLVVTSYAMPNGATGSFNYRDFNYTNCLANCNVTGAALSGGTGKLTDGVSPVQDWSQQGQLTQWVGWDSNQQPANPTITFFFGSSVDIDSVTLWLSNTRSGGVGQPASISVGGTNHVIAADNVNVAPHAYTISGLNLSGSSVAVQLFQAPGFSWVMAAEVSFDGTSATSVPLPGSVALLGLGLVGMAIVRRHKN